jgi:hypothetical protein
LAGLSNWAWPVDQHVFTDSDFSSSEILKVPEHTDEGYIINHVQSKKLMGQCITLVIHLSYQFLLKNKSPFAKGKARINKRQKK